MGKILYTPDGPFPGATVYHPIARAWDWARTPGNYDVTHGRVQWPTDGNPWGIPTIHKGARPPKALRVYTTGDRVPPRDGEALHFFTDDYRFEPVWSRLAGTLPRIQAFGRALSPDFSVRLGNPPATLIYNVYRNRWVGAYWQAHGIEVVPSICWIDPTWDDMNFAGLERGTGVAVTTNSCLIDDECAQALRRTVLELVKRVSPEFLLVYGDPLVLPALPASLPVFPYATKTPIAQRRGAKWLTVLHQPNDRWAIFSVERRKFLRMNLTYNGLWRQLSTWMPSDNAQHLIDTGSTSDSPAFRDWAECVRTHIVTTYPLSLPEKL